MKRLRALSAMLAAVMCMTMVATPVMAEETEIPSETAKTEETEKTEPEETKKPAPKEEKKETAPEQTEAAETEATEPAKETEPAEKEEPAETEQQEGEVAESKEPQAPEEKVPEDTAKQDALDANSGRFGDNKEFAWSFNTKTGLLKITGTGNMPSFQDPDIIGDNRPWKGVLSKIKTVEISEGVETISNFAFQNCKYMTSVKLPNTLDSIGVRAFLYCRSIKSIKLPDSVTWIRDEAFACCDKLETINIPSGVTEIRREAFWGCSSIKNIDLPNGLTKINPGTFVGCTSLKGIKIPDSVTEIGESAFHGCFSFTEVVIPDKVTTIGDDAFGDCHNMVRITIPSSVKAIGDKAFQQCTALTEVYYSGTKADFYKINISNDENDLLKGADLLISGNYHKITIGTSDHGKVIPSQKNASFGREITVNVDREFRFAIDTIKVNGSEITGNKFFMPDEDVTIDVTYKEIIPSANTLAAKGGKTAKVKYKKLKKKAQNVARSKIITISTPEGKVTYKLLSVNKKKKYFKINTANGVVTVKKKLKKGTYTLKVRVTAAGNENYNAASKTVSFKIKVK